MNSTGSVVGECNNPDDEALMCEALRRAGVAHPIVVARNGLDAVRLAVDARAGERPALVVVDLALPYLSGFGVIARLRAEPATMLVPAVVLSSSAERADIARAYAAGASSYLVKPLGGCRGFDFGVRYDQPEERWHFF